MSYAKRYFFSFIADDTEYTPDQGDSYTIEIHQKNYVGSASEIQAQRNPVNLEFPNSNKYPLLPLRASRAVLNLIADSTFSLADLYSEDERTWLLKVFREPKQVLLDQYLLWQGFILPEGCNEEFTFTPYVLSAQVADGLGVLKNLSFVQENGTVFSGTMSFKDVIWNCLNRLQIPGMDLFLCANIYPDSVVASDANDPLALTEVSVETYFKDEDLTPMTCEDVLKSVLEEWTACIVQQDGNWYVYRPNELAVSGTPVFRQYDSVDASYVGTVTQSINKTVGGLSQGEVIYAINRDQYKSIAKPYKNATISYKYGLLRSVLDNPTFAGASVGVGDPLGPRTDITVPGWTKFGTVENGINPDTSIIFYKVTTFNNANYFLNDETVLIDANQQIQLNISYESIPALTTTDMQFGVELFDGVDTYYLQQNGSGGYMWDTTGVEYAQLRSEFGTSTGTIISEPVPTAGTISFKVYPPENTSGDIVFYSVDAVKYNTNEAQIGEIHKAEQTGIFSFVPEIVNVFNGDGTTDLYRGTIYESDGDTPAENWTRRGLSENPDSLPFASQKPFLRIACEEMLRLHQRPMNVYDGTVAGFFPYISRFTVRDLAGVYLPVQVNYNLQSAEISLTLVEVSNDEIDSTYELQPDYGSVTKVSINGI